MAEANQLLPGFNHNVNHRGKLYHVQTEDSGTANPHVTTHLFLGGNVLASKKTTYADLVAAGDDLVARRKRMEAQHKEMLRALVRGAFDAVEAERTANARSFVPGQLDTGPAPSANPTTRVASLHRVAPAQPAVAPRDAAPAPIAPSVAAAPAPAAPSLAATAPPPPSAVARAAQPSPPERASTPPRPPPVSPSVNNGPCGDGWGPPVLPRARAAVARPPPPPPQARRLDELVLSYLAGAGDPDRQR